MTETLVEKIPTVDISPWLNPDSSEAEKQQAVDEIRHAATTYGFFQIVGHSVSREMRQQMFEATKRFFTLPFEERMDISVSKSVGKSYRGYEPYKSQTHETGLLPDTKEAGDSHVVLERSARCNNPQSAFVFGKEAAADDPEIGSFQVGPNLWPKSLADSDFREPAMAYQAKMLELVKVLLKILGRGLPESWNCPPNVFDTLTKNLSIPMRLLHYEPQPIVNEKQFGDHTDLGCVTILMQELGTRGLEVYYPPTSRWIPVPPQEDAYVINISDIMQLYTGGYYRSARHRVQNSTDQHRYSVAFFLNGNLKLDEPVLDGSGRRVNLAEYIRKTVAKTFTTADGAHLGDEANESVREVEVM